MEAAEIHEFSEQIKEGGEKRLTQVSLLIAIFAVLVAMVTVLSHREHTRAVLEQTRAADQWNEYQAHKLRVQDTQLASDFLGNDPSSQARLKTYKAEIAKWSAELGEESKTAHELEDKVEIAERRAARFDLGEALLQIAVVLASITLLTRQHRYVVIAGILALAGLLIAASAYLVR